MRDKAVPHRFKLVRDEDESGVSGEGVVAYGMNHPNGKTVLIWNTEPSSVAVYDSLEDVKTIHGHNGKTRVEWIDDFPDGGAAYRYQPKHLNVPEKHLDRVATVLKDAEPMTLGQLTVATGLSRDEVERACKELEGRRIVEVAKTIGKAKFWRLK